MAKSILASEMPDTNEQLSLRSPLFGQSTYDILCPCAIFRRRAQSLGLVVLLFLIVDVAIALGLSIIVFRALDRLYRKNPYGIPSGFVFIPILTFVLIFFMLGMIELRWFPFNGDVT
jgi:hypothetical protein